MKRFRSQVNFEDNKVGRLQSACKEIFDDITGREIIDGIRIDDVALVTTTKRIAHGLGRVPNGWIVVGIYGSATVWEVSRDELFLTLDCSANVTADLWVF